MVLILTLVGAATFWATGTPQIGDFPLNQICTYISRFEACACVALQIATAI